MGRFRQDLWNHRAQSARVSLSLVAYARGSPQNRVTERHQQVARRFGGKPIRPALLEAGYSPPSANQGMARLRRSIPLAAAYAQEIARLKNLPVPTAEVRAQIVRAKLLENLRNNRDNAVQSLKLLGLDREVSLWQPESALGLIVVQLPKDLPEER
jgi:hypothetical protein